ncbi:RdgB/HAM1 family non-canonical purine NTP pyrophosphatase [Cytophagaceae bacterium 50C-KIRBA]|uniref:dITP/XTP pyrophosphatase n=1 Tax=Aquirufa beregesia TaxID=2516556 RepID=A0ABX0F048_9BACT|nr:RdgB/HAM1 family non-canonical purine NTP pyrophosphatase [Aquirufa beregesia]NGZ45252.1 RdgB/HAM1 family non-canonical purine NTP pyrophosphatase [Aquirufa beregesia]
MLPILYLATQNLHKVEEIAALLNGQFEVRTVQDLGLAEEIPETGSTLEENSMLKAQFIANRYQVTCLSDDSGLEVEALGGAPGVYSARYAGEPKNDQRNLDLLLQNLSTENHRKARFVTVLTYHTQGEYVQFEGEIQGNITLEARGTSGFGYDPVFQPEGSTRTFAEMTLAEKNQMAHRARALQKFKRFVDEIGKSHDK